MIPRWIQTIAVRLAAIYNPVECRPVHRVLWERCRDQHIDDLVSIAQDSSRLIAELDRLRPWWRECLAEPTIRIPAERLIAKLGGDDKEWLAKHARNALGLPCAVGAQRAAGAARG